MTKRQSVQPPKQKDKPAPPADLGPRNSFTPEEAAAWLNVSVMTVRRFVADGALKCEYIGRLRRDGKPHRMRFTREHLQAFKGVLA